MSRQNTRFQTVLPECEREFQRSPKLGYEPDVEATFIRYLEHGAPNQLIRWHFHDEYEVHLITCSSGKTFVGDYIGQFEPGHLSLIGSRLPHNWITTDMPESGIALRDKCIQFRGEALYQCIDMMPELKNALALLDRAKTGIEFFGISAEAEALMDALNGSSGLHRLSLFIQLLELLAGHDNYRTMSSVQLRIQSDDQDMDRISEIVDFISENYSTQFNMAEIAQQFGMSESRFSRFFRRRTGNTFTDFVNRLRVNKACQLLLDTDQYISTICYNVGFNNVANFNRRFMEIRGMTPTEFRRTGLLRY